MTGDGQYNVDKVLVALGPKGRYTFAMFLLASLVEFPAVFQLLDNVFIGQDVPHQCAAPGNESAFHQDMALLGNVSITYGECNIEARLNGTLVKESDCDYGYEYELPVDMSVKSEFDLVCQKKTLFSLTQTLVFVGQGIGALAGPSVSDRFGRRVSMIACNFLMLVVGIAIAYSPSYIFFAAFKLLAGACQQGTYIAKCVYCLEIFPADDRRLAATLCGLTWAFGEMVLTFVAYLMKDYTWTSLQLVLSLFSLTSILQIWLLDESLRWLVANGKSEDATKAIKKAARWNKKSFEEVFKAGFVKEEGLNMEIIVNPDSPTSESDSDNGNDNILQQSKTKPLTFLDLLLVRRLLINACCMWVAWFSCSLGFFTLYLTASALSGDLNLNYFLMGLMEMPACIFFYFAFNSIGRKPTTIILYALLGISLFGIGICKHLSSGSGDIFDIFTLIFTLLGVTGAQGSFFAVFFYAPEIFPTNIRNQAVGVASFVARIGAILAPFTGVLMEVAVWAPGLIIGCIATVVTFLLTCLPETKGRQLPQTIEDLQGWYVKTENKEPLNKNEALTEDAEKNEELLKC